MLMKLIEIKVKGIHIGLIALLTMMTSAMPFIFFAFPYHPYKFLIALSILLILMLMVINGRFVINDLAKFMFLSMLMAWVIQALHFEMRAITLIFHVIAVFVVYMYLSDCNVFAKWVIWLCNFSLIIASVAVISYVLYMMDLIEMNPVFLRPGNDFQIIYMFGLSFTNALYNVSGELVPRVSSFFDEPGQFGLYLTYIIILESILKMPFWRRYVYIVAGLTSLSLAFILSILPLFFLFFVDRKRVFDIIAVPLFFIVILFLINVSYSYEMIDFFNQRVFGRLEYDEMTIISGNNRFDSTVEGYQNFLKSPIIGMGGENLAANIVATLGAYGALGVFFLYFPMIYFFYLSIKKNDFVFFIVLLILLANFMQRPINISFFKYLIIFTIVNAYMIQSWHWGTCKFVFVNDAVTLRK